MISIRSFSAELQQITLTKTGADLTPEARAKIKPSNFALTSGQSSTGKKAYPVDTEQRARAALGFVGMHGSPEQKAEVYKDVARKYPHLAAKSSVPALKSRVEKSAAMGMSPIGAPGPSSPNNPGPTSPKLPGAIGGPAGGTGMTAGGGMTSGM